MKVDVVELRDCCWIQTGFVFIAFRVINRQWALAITVHRSGISVSHDLDVARSILPSWFKSAASRYKGGSVKGKSFSGMTTVGVRPIT